MKLELNGKSEELTGVNTLSELIAARYSASENLIVEYNEKIAGREVWPRTQLRDGDKILIMSIVGGG